MSNHSPQTRPNKTEQALLDALDRILRGAPRNDKLREKLKLGKDILNPSSVALEADVSRTLIGHEKCAYPRIRQKILEAKVDNKRPLAPDPSLAGLRSEIHQLKQALKIRDALIAEQTVEITRLRMRYEPDARGNVAPFRRRDGRRANQTPA